MEISAAQIELCKVCGLPSNVFRFGIFCCRACCAFFRRSIAQKKQYECIHNNRCIINQEGMRNACRACRMRRCYDVGMNADELCLPQNDKESVTAGLSLPSISNMLPLQNDSLISPKPHLTTTTSEFPILRQLSNHFKSLLRAQKSLYTVENPGIIFTEAVPKPITHLEYMKFENATLTLIHSFLVETKDLFGEFVLEEWAAFTRPIALKYSILHKAFITSQTSTPEGSMRIMTHYGYYMDKDSLKLFFGDSQFVDQRVKFIHVQLREIEAAALCGIMLFEYMHHNGQLNDMALQKKEAFYAEIHANLIESYGLKAAGVRLISIMPFIMDTTETEVVFKELMMMSKIFIPPEPGDNECGKNSIWEKCPANWE
ncbi:zinc finger, c4 type (two domains) domain-containing protein [Ditylenchus destructor]|uniref:Zinc finger, c4 type (Two domains) domain-containing protein n=1 Tax=Ditylenchus destructor TaxID=166010 RepID=A0AAD4N4I0_9BILA|nr:zinc finger, c4 type (two domains) domain-containing protein [Ditylenchus destructor]